MKILLEVFRRLYFTEIPQTNSEPLRLALESRENITVPKFVTLLDQFLSYRFDIAGYDPNTTIFISDVASSTLFEEYLRFPDIDATMIGKPLFDDASPMWEIFEPRALIKFNKLYPYLILSNPAAGVAGLIITFSSKGSITSLE